MAEDCIQKRPLNYDKDGDNHYDTISAFIKSMRGSDPDAAVFYLAKMLESGEDIKFIARRIMICASEDVGNADPQALILAVNASLAVGETWTAGGQNHSFTGSHLCGMCTEKVMLLIWPLIRH